MQREGYRWFGGGTNPYLRGSGNVSLFVDARARRLFTEDGGVYTGPENSAWTLVRTDSGTADELYTMTNPETGEVSIFYGMDIEVAEKNRGRLKERTTRSLQAAGLTGITYFYRDVADRETVDCALTSEGWLIDYDYYNGSTDDDRLKSVSIYAGPTTSDTLTQRVEYLYFDSVSTLPGTPTPSPDLGSSGDLVQVTVLKRATHDTGNDPSDLSIRRTTQYRYYNTLGRMHQLKAVFEADAVQRLLDYSASDTIADPEHLLSKGDTDDVGAGGSAVDIDQFASRSFGHYNWSDPPPAPSSWGSENLIAKYGGQYDSFRTDGYWDGAVQWERIGGSCSSCGGGTVNLGVKKEYYYLELTNWYIGDGSDQPNRVVRIVIEDTLDSSDAPRYRKIYGVNHKGMWLRKAFLEDPMDVSDDNVWCESRTLNDDWRIVQHRMPSAHKDKVVDDTTLKKFLDPTNGGATLGSNDDDTVNDLSGVVYHFDFDVNFGTGKRPTGKRISEGTDGPRHYLWARDYGDGDGDSQGKDDDEGKLLVAEYDYPAQTTNRADASRAATYYHYTFWDTADTAVKTVRTEHPVIEVAQNGSGVATETYQYFDEKGRLRWEKDGEETVTYYGYHPETGGLAYQMVDVDTDNLTNEIRYGSLFQEGWGASEPVPTGFINTDDDNLQLETQWRYDVVGRQIVEIESDGAAHITLYYTNGIATFPYLSGITAAMPVRVVKNDGSDVTTNVIGIKPSEFDLADTSIPTDDAHFVTLRELGYDSISGQLEYADAYHDIDGPTGIDSAYRTVFLYDELGRRSAAGLQVSDSRVQWQVHLHDVLGRAVERRHGVSSSLDHEYNDLNGAITSSPPTGFSGYATSSTFEYDESEVGDGYLTRETVTNTVTAQHAVDKYTTIIYHRTFRGHIRGIERRYDDGSSTIDVKPYRAMDVDWRGNITADALYSTEPAWSVLSASYDAWVGVSSGATGRYELVETDYDMLGRTFETKRFPGSQANNYLKIQRYYDRRGKLVAQSDPYGVSAEYAYDSAGRMYQDRIVLALETTRYSGGSFQYVAPTPVPDFADMTSGDGGVIVLTHRDYEGSEDTVLAEHRVEIDYSDHDGLSLSGGTPSGGVRNTIHFYYNNSNQQITEVDYGCADHDDGNVAWQAKTVPDRSGGDPSAFTSNNNRLVTQYLYDADTGSLASIVDPQGISNTLFYDDLGRLTFVAENHVNFSDSTSPPTGMGGGADRDEDRAIGWTYNGFTSVTDLTLYNGTSDTQVTKYWYDDDYDASLETHVAYPDSTSTPGAGSDLVSTTYHFDGTVDNHSDQRGVLKTYYYDELRRTTLASATTIPSEVDDAVKSIGRVYDDYGRITSITSYSDTAGTSAVSQIEYAYDPTYGYLTKSTQDHDGVVDGSGTEPSVQYGRDGVAMHNVFTKGLRPSTVTYPSGRVMHATYDSDGSVSDRLHRVHKLETDVAGSPDVDYAEFAYNGIGRHVGSLVGPHGTFKHELHHDKQQSTTGNNVYESLDRFGRIERILWARRTQNWKIHIIDYKYDYVGNRTQRTIPLSEINGTYTSDKWDHVYTYDDLHRLTNVKQGSETSGSITTLESEQDWTLDELGNWSTLRQDDDGDLTWDIDQTRTHNDSNELLTASGWSGLTHDTAGDMTSFPSAKDPSSTGMTAVYDAWSRLVEIRLNISGSPIVQANRYDGLNRRIERDESSSYGGGSHLHFYYNEEWQVLEERIETSGTIDSDPINQYLWGPNYEDELAVRWYDSDVDGANVQEYGYQHDALYNVIGIATSDGNASEHVTYSPYGQPTWLESDFDEHGTQASNIGNEILYTGRRVDPATGLQINRHRYFHRHLGRWVTRDPIGYWGGLNVYGYVGGFPTKYTDPSGLRMPDADKPWPAGPRPQVDPHPYPKPPGYRPPVGYAGPHDDWIGGACKAVGAAAAVSAAGAGTVACVPKACGACATAGAAAKACLKKSSTKCKPTDRKCIVENLEDRLLKEGGAQVGNPGGNLPRLPKPPHEPFPIGQYPPR